jgi:hypothetical protein
MPGTSLMSKMAFKKHEAALRKFNLVDENHKPTWFTDAVPDEMKLFRIAGDAMQGMSPEDRAAYGRAAWGAQGQGAVSVLGDPVVNEQMRAIDNITKSPAFLDRYHQFGSAYPEGATIQNARQSMQQFNVTMGELARITLPSINVALGGFKSVLEGIRNLLPGGDGKGAAVVGGGAILGAGGGAAAGAVFGGPVGMVGGAVIGGVGGAALGYSKAQGNLQNRDETDNFVRALRENGETPFGGAGGVAAGYVEQQAAINKEKWAQEERERSKANDAVKGQGAGGGGVFPGGTSRAPVPPIHLNLNIDGRALAQAVSEGQAQSSTYQTDTPASNGAGLYGP